jgi:hypothetical protein
MFAQEVLDDLVVLGAYDRARGVNQHSAWSDVPACCFE